jgi:hypothetical protein
LTLQVDVHGSQCVPLLVRNGRHRPHWTWPPTYTRSGSAVRLALLSADKPCVRICVSRGVTWPGASSGWGGTLHADLTGPSLRVFVRPLERNVE